MVLWSCLMWSGSRCVRKSIAVMSKKNAIRCWQYGVVVKTRLGGWNRKCFASSSSASGNDLPYFLPGLMAENSVSSPSSVTESESHPLQACADSGNMETCSFNIKQQSELSRLCRSLLAKWLWMRERLSPVFQGWTHVRPQGLMVWVQGFKRVCRQLGFLFIRLFQLFLDTHFVPRLWRWSVIVPVPKNSSAKVLNDFRPIALTSILCKCLERKLESVDCASGRLYESIAVCIQGKQGGGLGNVTLTLLDLVSRHIDTSDSFVRILFMDVSSALNSIQSHLLLKWLLELQANSSLVLWIRSFLCDRPQRVSVRGCFSDELVRNTGAPQGCVLSPVLFSIYSNIPMEPCVTTPF